MSYMAQNLATLSRFQDSSRFYDPPGMAPEDYDDSVDEGDEEEGEGG